MHRSTTCGGSVVALIVMAAFPGDRLGMRFVDDLDELSPAQRAAVEQMVAEMEAERQAENDQPVAS